MAKEGNSKYFCGGLVCTYMYIVDDGNVDADDDKGDDDDNNNDDDVDDDDNDNKQQNLNLERNLNHDLCNAACKASVKTTEDKINPLGLHVYVTYWIIFFFLQSAIFCASKILKNNDTV